MKINLRRIVPFICAGALWFAAASCAENRGESDAMADLTIGNNAEAGNNGNQTTTQVSKPGKPDSDVSTGAAEHPDNALGKPEDIGGGDNDYPADGVGSGSDGYPGSTDPSEGSGSADGGETGVIYPEFNRDDIKVFLENTSIPFGTESFLIKYEYISEDDKNTCFGVEFELEKLVGGNWEKVEFSNNAAFIEIGLILGSDSKTHQSEVNLRDNFYKEPLTRGDYRVIKNVGNFTYTLDFSIV